MTRYRCPECKTEVEIDPENKTIHMVVSYPSPKIGSVPKPIMYHIPLHPDCELGRPINEINLDLLEKV